MYKILIYCKLENHIHTYIYEPKDEKIPIHLLFYHPGSNIFEMVQQYRKKLLEILNCVLAVERSFIYNGYEWLLRPFTLLPLMVINGRNQEISGMEGKNG